MDISKMIHRLKTYQNGVHGDFFLEVADLLTSLITEKEPSAQSPAAMTGSLVWWETAGDDWNLRVRGRESSPATVYETGTWHTWDRDGNGGENSSEKTIALAKKEATYSALRQGFI